MKIGFDARMYGLKHAGIGRYVENLLKNVLQIDNKNTYHLLVRERDKDLIQSQLNSLKKNTPSYSQYFLHVVEARHYSIKEQILLPLILGRIKPDLVHFPHFNTPYFYRRPYIVTIHDLLWHENKGTEVTTLSPFQYKIKYIGYRSVFANTVLRAKKILVPSNWVKNKLVNTYKHCKDKLHTIYEGVDPEFLISTTENSFLRENAWLKIAQKYKLPNEYYLYVGSAYPHKNLNLLLDAIAVLQKPLVIVSSRDVFWKKIRDRVYKDRMEKLVFFLGFVDNAELAILYRNAKAFIFPSLSEGFGLGGVEAMSLGCPVIASSRGALPEIYQNAALFFDPENVWDLIKKVRQLDNNANTKNKLVKNGFLVSGSYKWETTARETIKQYESCDSL